MNVRRQRAQPCPFAEIRCQGSRDTRPPIRCLPGFRRGPTGCWNARWSPRPP